ncbi:MAG: hypothetical protein M1827_004714 [Pycnora praestabilis]|nr:MAG: hypothetical protein M1827_004714 [Pycnora praestabilis]
MNSLHNLSFLSLLTLLISIANCASTLASPGYQCEDDAGQPPASDCLAALNLMKESMANAQKQMGPDSLGIVQWLRPAARFDPSLMNLTEKTSPTPLIWNVDKCSIAIYLLVDWTDYYESDIASFNEIIDAATLVINGCVSNKSPLDLSGGLTRIGLRNLVAIFIFTPTSAVGSDIRMSGWSIKLFKIIDYLSWGLRPPTLMNRRRRKKQAADLAAAAVAAAESPQNNVNDNDNNSGKLTQEFRRKLLQQSYCVSGGGEVCGGGDQWDALGIECIAVEVVGALNTQIFGIPGEITLGRAGLSICAFVD